MGIDHVSVGVSNVNRSKQFYDAALAPLGIAPIMPVEHGGQLIGVGYGAGNKPSFWIQRPIDGQPASMGNGAHVAFQAETRAAVDAFHRAALDHGGVEDGEPGLRPHYHPSYYGAFVRDPDGNKIEAVKHGNE